MGLKNWINRPMRGHHLGVEDLIRGDEGVPASKRRSWALLAIDAAPFQVWVVIVAGIGFLTDSFGLFCLNVVTPMLGYVYWSNNLDGDGVPSVPASVKTAMMCSTLVGTMIGQIAFGFAADILGRRKMYGLELVVVIVGTMLLITSSRGEQGSMAVAGWLIAWRAIMGLGIGADYPLSACITAEFAPRKHRARMMSWVFFAQPVGQLLANSLSLAAVQGFKSQITNTELACIIPTTREPDLQCIRAIDRLWRLVIGLGIIPALVALAFRFTIPESPRFKLDVLRNVHTVFEDTKDYFGKPEVDAGGGELHDLPLSPRQPDALRRPSSDSSVSIQTEDTDNDDYAEGGQNVAHQRRASQALDLPPGDPNFVPPLASWADAKEYFITEGNWQYLLGTSLAWLFLDFAFCGLGLSSPDIVRHIWNGPNKNNPPVFDSLRENSWHTLVIVSIGATIGGALMIKVIKYVSPRVIQLWGFIVLFVLFIVTGSAWTSLLETTSQSGLIVLYALAQVAFNLGPNVTTFIIPAEIFPTRYRCTCHGIAAASGKLGSWLVQIFLAYAFRNNKEDEYRWERDNFGHVLQVMSAFMLAGAVTTYFLVPETRDHDNKSRTLEVLACGKKVIDKLNQQRQAEED